METKFKIEKADLLMKLSKVKKEMSKVKAELSAATSKLAKIERQAGGGIDPASYERVTNELAVAKKEKVALEKELKTIKHQLAKAEASAAAGGKKKKGR